MNMPVYTVDLSYYLSTAEVGNPLSLLPPALSSPAAYCGQPDGGHVPTDKPTSEMALTLLLPRGMVSLVCMHTPLQPDAFAQLITRLAFRLKPSGGWR